MKIFQSLLSIGMVSFTSVIALQPNPPTWPSNVHVFTPGDSTAQGIIDAIYQENGGQTPDNHGQWSDSRYALLFKPGTHNLNVNVGYYTSVIGLGSSPADTQISAVTCQEGSFDPGSGALDTFWRSAENFTTTATKAWWSGGPVCMLWAVSQASPLRRVNINGDLCLYQYVPPYGNAGYSSGGFMADCKVSGTIHSGSQQQWFARNTQMLQWADGNWNMVFAGCQGAPAAHCGTSGGKPYTVVSATPVIAEKPYITIDSQGHYYLNLPNIEHNKTSCTQDYTQVTKIDFQQVYVATTSDTADTITSAINGGYHIILTPGNYNLAGTIQVNKANTCILGIGFPTLISGNGQPCIQVGSVDGVRIAGILLQAGPSPTPTLLQWGTKGDQPKSGFLQDCFARVGGPNNSATSQVQADIMVQINSANLVCDNLWLWRADHDVGGLVTSSHNPCHTGLQVNGDNVTAYGLAVEHTLQNLTEWNGNNGSVYFYQSEYPYDVTQANYGTPGYVAYKVGSNVTTHTAYGVGVYCYFRDYTVTVPSGISTPQGSGIQFINALTIFLTGNGGISNVINNVGGPVSSANADKPVYVCKFPVPYTCRSSVPKKEK